jgi:hypothetical protein
MSHWSARAMPCCLRPEAADSASGSKFSFEATSGFTFALWPGDSLTILKMALSVGFIRFVSSTDTTQAKELLTFAPVGLPPTEHVYLSWTHCLSKTSKDLNGWELHRS